MDRGIRRGAVACGHVRGMSARTRLAALGPHRIRRAIDARE